MAQKKLKPATLVLVLAVMAVAWWFENREQADAPAGGGTPTTTRPSEPRAADDALRQAIRAQRSGVWVEGEGTIVHLLPDDREGSRHQLCLVELELELTLVITPKQDGFEDGF